MGFTVDTGDGRRVSIDAPAAKLGQSSECEIRLTDARVLPVHATIRKVADRWVVEAAGDWCLQVGELAPARLCWLKPGDRVRLTESGPAIVFEPPNPVEPKPAPSVANPARDPAPVARTAVKPVPVAQERTRPNGVPAWAIVLGLAGCGLGAVVVVTIAFVLPRFFRAASAIGASESQNEPDQQASAETASDGRNDPGAAVRKQQPPDRPAKKSAPASAAPGAPSALSDADLRARFADSVVWIGLNLENNTLFQSSGWLISDSAAVTTADIVTKLLPVVQGQKGDVKVVVRTRGRTWPVTAARLHPDYDPADPGNRSTSVPHGIGVLIFGGPAETGTAFHKANPPQGPAADAQVTMLAFDSALGPGEPYNESKVSLQIFGGKVAEVLQTSPDVSPIYVLKIQAPKSARGAPLLDDAGNLLGTLSMFDDRPILIPAKEAFRVSE